MSEKQPQILIFNATGEFMAIARSIRSAAGLQKLMKTISNSAARTNLATLGNIVFDTMSSH